MNDTKARDFIFEHCLSPEQLDPAAEAAAMLKDMRAGLRGEKSSMPMIPTYLSNDGAVPRDVSAVVIDAGGTNFRSALVRFGAEGAEITELRKARMPGTDSPCSWEQFISFVADNVQPLLDRADSIGFCFSYSAEITPEMDGRVIRIDKEVVVTGSTGKLVGASLREELRRRGLGDRKTVILNDTVAVLLGGASTLDKSRYSGFIGQVSGTGTNTCVSLPCREIPKLGIDSAQGMLINLESGLYDGITGGDIDRRLDMESRNPGSKIFEKLTAGGYLGELCRLALELAAERGLISPGSAERLRALPRIDGADVDAWSKGEALDRAADCAEDGEFIGEVCRAVLERSARCMCVNLLALALLTGEGRDAARPILACAEGSLVQKCDVYRQELLRQLQRAGAERMGVFIELRVGRETTFSGSAAAALLN